MWVLFITTVLLHEAVKSFCLKVPKCENFHRTDFFNFFIIKPLWWATLGQKLKIQNFNIKGFFGGLFFENFVLAQAEPALKQKNFSS